MKKKNNIFTRIKAKTFETLLIFKLTKEYCLSPVEADVLTHDLKEYIRHNCENMFKEGDTLWTAVVKDEPAGKPLNLCKTKQIKLDVYPEELIELFFKDIKSFNFKMVDRLSWHSF